MGNRKHRHKPSKNKRDKPSAKPAGDVVSDLKSVITAMRGRRAAVLAERLAGQPDIAPSERGRLTALAREAQVRELFSNGHAREAVGIARDVALREPSCPDHWSLGLRVRCGLIPDVAARLKDAAWRARLRREILIPDDVGAVVEEALAADSGHVTAAWDFAADGHTDAALERLKQVGRQSLLVDWRLFVQMLVHLQEGDAARAETAFSRILPDSCAHRLAGVAMAQWRGEAPGIEPPADIGERLRQDDAISGIRVLAERIRSRGVGSCCDEIVRLTRALHGQRRRGLAACILAACAQALSDRVAHDRFVRYVNSAVPDAWMGWVRMGSDGRSNIDAETVMETLARSDRGTPEERAMLIVAAARCARDVWARRRENPFADPDDFDIDDIESIEGEPSKIVSLIREQVRKAASLWPQLGEAYDMWEWAEHEMGHASCTAQKARADAMPDREAAWDRLAVAALAHDCHDLFEQAIQRLTAFPGVAARCEQLRQQRRYRVVVDAFRAKRMDTLRRELPLYQGDDPMQCAIVRVIDWLTATTPPEKNDAARRMVELKTPWLALKIVTDTREGSQSDDLPLPIQAAIQDDPEAVLADFRMVLAANKDLPHLSMAATIPLVNALRDDRVAIDRVNDTASAMLDASWSADPPCETESLLEVALFDVSRRLLDRSEPDNQASGLLLRAFLLWCQESFGDEWRYQQVMRKLLAAAGRLAVSDRVRERRRRLAEQCQVEEAVAPPWRRPYNPSVKAIAKLIEAQRACPDMASIARSIQPRSQKQAHGDKPSRQRPIRAPRRKAMPERPPLPVFDPDQFNPATSIEIEVAIDGVAGLPPEQRADIMARLRAKIERFEWLTAAAKARLMARCDAPATGKE